jgi:RNA polymerase sigma-70 factor (sigma-E family)
MSTNSAAQVSIRVVGATIAFVHREAGESLADAHARTYRQLVGLAAGLLGDRAAAEDVVQDAFVNVFRGWDRIRDRDRLDQYLRRAVFNGARSRRGRLDVRSRLRAVRHHDAPGADEAVIASDRQRQLLTRLWSLPARQRECLVLRYYAELSEREIAETLGISAGSVKTHTARGIQVLSAEWEEDR